MSPIAKGLPSLPGIKILNQTILTIRINLSLRAQTVALVLNQIRKRQSVE
jgi:hypothetical protein